MTNDEINDYKDISNYKLDNKMYNLQYVMNPNIFKFLAIHTHSYTDMSIAYIPNHFVQIDEKNESKFIPPCEENNYADISFINNNMYYSIKVCRIKTFDAIPLDGNVLTYHADSINNHTFILFYSINPNEFNKTLIVSTEIYDKLASLNGNEHIRYFNASDTSKLKNVLKFTDSDMFYTENINEFLNTINIPNESIVNINIKRQHCLKTLYYYKVYKMNNKNKLISPRTHFGKQYSAYNLITGEIRNFRDCNARNNFFKLKGIKLPSNTTINHNCINMTNIVFNEKRNDYRINLNEEGWIITNHFSNHSKLINFIQSLISIIYIKSKRISKKLKMILSKRKQSIILILNTAKNKIKQIKTKLKNKIKYKRPLYLLKFVTSNYNTNKTLKFMKI